MGNIVCPCKLYRFHWLHRGSDAETNAKSCIFVFRICRQENRHLFVVVVQSFLTTMCRKVNLSIFISKRKCLINSKCYTKDPFSFTLYFLKECFVSTAVLLPFNPEKYNLHALPVCPPPDTLTDKYCLPFPFQNKHPLTAPHLLLRRPCRRGQDTLSQHSRVFLFFFRGEPTEG